MLDEENLPKQERVRDEDVSSESELGQNFFDERGQGKGRNLPQFPPPPFGVPFPPPVYEEYEAEVDLDSDEIEELLAQGFYISDEDEEDEEGFVEVDEDELLEEEEVEFIKPHEEIKEIFSQEKIGKSLIKDEAVKQIQRQNYIQTSEADEAALKREHLLFFFKAIVYLGLVAGFFVGALGLFLYLNGNIFRKGGVDLSAFSEQEKDIYLYWKAKDSPVNNLLKEFYGEMATYELLSKSQSDRTNGTMLFEGESFAYRALKNRSGNIFLKMENSEGAFSYFFPENTLGRLLLEEKISGKSEPIDSIKSEALRAALLYDDYFLDAVFPTPSLFGKNKDRQINLLPSEEIEGKTYAVLQVVLPNNTMNFYFNTNTKLLSFVKYIFEGNLFEIRFSGYRRFGDGFVFPAKREVFVNSSLKIQVNNTLISRKNEILAFPY